MYTAIEKALRMYPTVTMEMIQNLTHLNIFMKKKTIKIIARLSQKSVEPNLNQFLVRISIHWQYCMPQDDMLKIYYFTEGVITKLNEQKQQKGNDRGWSGKIQNFQL